MYALRALQYAVEAEVATITLHRPEALNAITPTMLAELEQAVQQAVDDSAVRAVVLTGSGKAFSAGVDLKALGERKLERGKVGDILDLPARAAIRAIVQAPKPVVAKVQGYCFTGALELALACDMMVVANEAKFGDTHAKWGLRPTWGMSARLPAAVGVARARELSLTARTFTGEEALAMGMAVRAAPRAELDALTKALCDELLANSPEAMAAYKALYREPALDDALAREAATEFEIGDTEQRLDGFR